MKRLFALTALLVLTFSSHASAHVLLRDERANIGAVLHATPDDDPIAGERGELYFDIQDEGSEVRIPYNGYDLYVTNEDGQETKVETGAIGTTVIAGYTFPSQGLYKLTLRSQPKYDGFGKIEMTDSIRVTRGVVLGQVSQPAAPAWAEAGVVFGLSIMAVTVILAINNRNAILEYSRFKW